MAKTSFADNGALMSPRTAKYVEAIIREGDNFDYCKWLQRVRDEEVQAKQVSEASASPQAVPGQIGNRPSTFDNPDTSVRPAPRLMVNLRPLPISQFTLKLQDRTVKAQLIRWLEKVSDAWHEFQASRARDAIYDYLEAVFAIVMHYKVRRRAKKLLRHAFKFANLPFDKNADPFTAAIRCTCDDQVDSKTISKWARALRYAAHRKAPRTRLKKFMKEAGGVNACADLYARYFGRGGR